MTPSRRTPSPAIHYQPLVFVLAAACAGIAADRSAGVPLPWWTAAGAGSLLLWLLLRRAGRDRRAAVACLAAVVAVAGAWHHLHWSWYDADDLGFFARPTPQPVCVEALVRKGPRRVAPLPPDPMRGVPVGERTRLELEVQGLRDGTRWTAARGRSTLTVEGQLAGIGAGDRLRIFGSLSSPRRAVNPGDFDQSVFDRRSRQLCRLWAEHPDCVVLIESAPRRGLWWWVERVRSSARNTLWQNLSAERADLASAVLLGAREEIDTERTDVFVETGTVHLLAVSGLHVGIFAGVFLLALRALPVSTTAIFWAVLALTVAYTLLTDVRPPAIRASILISMLCFAHAIGRPPSAWNTLAAAGLVVLALNPADLFSTGVHLSFLAVATLIWIQPRWFSRRDKSDPLERLIEQSRSRGERALRRLLAGVGRAAAASAAVWIITLPLVMSRFHVVAFGAVALNAVVWIPMTAAVAFGFLLILSGWLLPLLTGPLGWACESSLGGIQTLIDWGHRVPSNHLWTPGLPDWWLLGFYAQLGVSTFCLRTRPAATRWALAAMLAWVGAGGLASQRYPSGNRLVCTFISVGHGAAIVLEMPGGPVILYDAGRLSSPELGARSIAACLWEKKISAIDGVVISHAGSDHFNALPELLRRFPTTRIYATARMFEGVEGSVAELLDAIASHRIPIVDLALGDRFSVGSAVVEVLHPPAAFSGESDNTASVVLAIEFQGRRILLPGDLEGSGLALLLSGERVPCDVLLAPHHGSWRNDSAGLAAWCSPRWVVFSGHADPRKEVVAETYQQVGAEVLCTGECGAVTVTIEGGQLRVETYLANSP